MIVVRGTPRADTFVRNGDDSYEFHGLGGNDAYTLRLFDRLIPQPRGPDKLVYFRDEAREAANGGTDTVTLVNHYGPAEGFTGIFPAGMVTADELVNIEIIKAAPSLRTVAGDRIALSWHITAGVNANMIVAPFSADRLDGGGGDDTIRAGGGSDVADGGTGRDRIFGDGGADTITGGDSSDVLNGGTGFDYVSFVEATTAVTVNLAAGTTSDRDTLTGIEGIIGGRSHDRLIGSNAAETLRGGTGNDTANGGAGNDRLDGEGGNDILNGGAANDWLDGGTGGRDSLDGGTGNDRLMAGSGNDALRGGAGTDRFVFPIDTGHIYSNGDTANLGRILDYEDGDRIILSGGGDSPSGVLKQQVGNDTWLIVGDYIPVRGAGTNDTRNFGTIIIVDTNIDEITAADLPGFNVIGPGDGYVWL